MSEIVGQRKVVMTKWMLIIFTLGTAGYMVLNGLQGVAMPESFYMSFVMGLGTIGGAFTAGNIFEHRANAECEMAKADMQKTGMDFKIQTQQNRNNG